MENVNQETIVAISTGSSSGAISIVRMSGSKAVFIADQIFKTKKGLKPSDLTPRMLTLGEVKTASFSEQAMVVVFKSPHTYTGEDLVEFQCHGGTQIANGIMKECISRGARIATNGEFTKRAFLNGKMTLSSAEGMIDMITAESDAEVRAGLHLTLQMNSLTFCQKLKFRLIIQKKLLNISQRQPLKKDFKNFLMILLKF